MLRTQVREEIFKILFRLPFMSKEDMEEQIQFSLEDLDGKSKKNIQYIENKVNEIRTHLDEIDLKIQKSCEGWSFNRIGKAELTIMRIAVYEIFLEDEISENIAINEAVELAKVYCNDDAKGFINAVLAKVVKNLG